MRKERLLLGLVIVLTITFFSLQVFHQELAAGVVRGFILPVLIYVYCLISREKNSFFFWFLVCYAVSEFLGIFEYYAALYNWVDAIRYYGGNIMYISAYMFLILEVIKSMNLKEVFSRFSIHFIILLIMDISCVILVSQISYSSDNFVKELPDLIMEVIYNIVIMLLLTFALINYISKHSKKAMNLLLGVLCFVVSEVVQVAYFYVDDDMNILGVIYTFLLIVAFIFLFIQSGMPNDETEDYNKQLHQANA